MSDRLINGNEAGNDLQTASNGAARVKSLSLCRAYMKDNLDLDETRFFMSQGKSTQNVSCLKRHLLYCASSAVKYNEIM